MGKLVEGKWRQADFNADAHGHFVRPDSRFRAWVRRDGSTPHPPAPGRYHLYVSWACPWAHRTLILRKLKGLEHAISISVVHPYMGDDGWFFSEEDGCTLDDVNGRAYLREVYVQADPGCTGRVTVPVLWDRELGTIVSNESREIMRMFDHEFDEFARHDVDFCPPSLRTQVDAAITSIYEPINNGVYRAGFARTQPAYDQAVREVFEGLDHWEQVLDEQRYLCGDVITEADWCLFATLLRFDPVYHHHFKCSRRRIADYHNLSNYLRELYQVEGVSETVDLDHVVRHYYGSHPNLNPRGIIPYLPEPELDAPHDRARLG